MTVERISAFSLGNEGGNPAGVLLTDKMLSDEKMLEIAKEVNYSETAFLVKSGESYRIRYFSPETEIAFCGHATIASGMVLGKNFGPGEYNLILNDGEVNLDVEERDGKYFSTISSVPTSSKDVNFDIANEVLDMFSMKPYELDERFPIKISFSGNDHLIIFVKEKQTLENMDYDFQRAKVLMRDENITTISILWQESDAIYHSRNAFAFGGVIEDPATGSAAIALGEYLRSIGVKKSGRIEILQGFNMNQPSRLFVEYKEEPNSSIKVSGESRYIK